MSHYDGPAFYRKQEKLKKRSTKNEVIDVLPEDVEVTVPPEAQTNVNPEKTSQPKTQLKAPATEETPEVSAFRNSAKTHVVTYNRALSEQRFYQQILAALEKTSASYYLFDTAVVAEANEPIRINYISIDDKNNDTAAPIKTQPEPTKAAIAQEPVEPTAKTAETPLVQTAASEAHDQPRPLETATASDSKAAVSKAEESVKPVEKTNSMRNVITPKPELKSEPKPEPQTVPVAKLETPTKTPAPKAPVAQSIAQRQLEKLQAQLTQKSTAVTSPKVPPVTAALPEKKTPVKSENERKVRSFTTTPPPDTSELTYQFPALTLLPAPTADQVPDMHQWAEQQKETLDETLEAFHVAGNVAKYTIGPTVTQFEVALDRGVKVSKITNLNDDLRLALAAKDIRIEAPIPGRSTVGIEIPNLKSRPVLLSEVIGSTAFKESQSPLTVALGVNLFGQPIIGDLAKMPHALIAGSTGSGKSVFINSLLTSIMYKATPEQVKLLLIDPKVVELAPYNGLPHLLAPVVSDTREASAALEWTVDEMEKRYQRFAAASVRNIEQFNEKAQTSGRNGLKMAYIVVIIDELADLMMSASNDVQDSIARITQKARAAGIHLIVATQRPSVDVVTGTIKNNIPTRIAFMVSSQIDSRTIIDASGAERLLGRGDMLYLGNGQNHPIRLQGTFIDNEIDAVIDFVKQQRPSAYQFKPNDLLKKSIAKSQEDDLMPQILDYLTTEKTISTSKLQRTFNIGYNRAANIIEDLEAHNYIGQAQGSKPRDVFFDRQDLEKIKES
ncbi:DNA translocase FtsK [Agrilactobacillus yilanensis]|uniref:DNA translocase FtsK n=1 Tax=Agrilactobacillus yilanensis TaxID=2485997 RepID=A0ABW4JC19_9LACO|nr:DNA translocase FtsK [Agrilactobacillus yilanensis]